MSLIFKRLNYVQTRSISGTIFPRIFCFTNCEYRFYVIYTNTFDSHVSYDLSLHFNSHFPGEPGQAGIRMSLFWILLELRVMEVVVTTGIIKMCKAALKISNITTNKPTPIFTGRMPFLSPNQQC